MGTPPRQSSLPKGRPQYTEFQRFVEPRMARVMDNSAYDTASKISVMFLDRTSPVPIWCFGSEKPTIGDFAIVSFLDGQKNSPYCAGLISQKAWTSNFIRVEKDKIRIQFPSSDTDVTGDPKNENDPKSHLRDDAANLANRGYVQIDATGIKLHVPNTKPITVEAGTVNIKSNAINVTAYDGSGTLQPVARVGDTVSVNVTGSGSDPQGGTVSITGTGTGTIQTGSSKLKSV